MKVHILVVDADPEARSGYRILFARHFLTIVGTLAAARTALSRERFDIVITDWTFPDGTAAELLRELPQGVKAPLRLIHAAGPLEEIEAEYIAGAADWLFEKPAWFDLYEQVRRFAPMSLDGPRRRTGKRRALALHVFLRSAAWSAPRRLSTVNVSENGLAFCSSEPLPPGEAIHVALALPRGARLRLVAVVRHSTPLPPGNSSRWLVGVEICELASEQRRALRTLVQGADCTPTPVDF